MRDVLFNVTLLLLGVREFSIVLSVFHNSYMIAAYHIYQVWEAASKALKDEEAMKQKLCDDLSNLVPISTDWVHIVPCCMQLSQALLYLIGPRK